MVSRSWGATKSLSLSKPQGPQFLVQGVPVDSLALAILSFFLLATLFLLVVLLFLFYHPSCQQHLHPELPNIAEGHGG